VPQPTHHLADQALANLVNQFARPLDFLRELVQNSIDSGSPRIEISLAFHPEPDDASRGVLEIHVDDFGEGMNEAIIDDQLTRLFSSTKEDDLTKIGKFGIGFTSIFAIGPEAVLLRTGRNGQYWELLFHADRSFDKLRIDEPVAGTKITLYKRMVASEVPRFVDEARFVLSYWCQHSDVPISWWDRTQGTEAPAEATADPFAAFADGQDHGGAVAINRPLQLDEAVLAVQLNSGGTEIVAGLCDPPRFGFYNGGLTLLHTRSEDALGEHATTLGHISFKVKNDRLEHTLTRDNVLQDVHWTEALSHVQTTRELLLAALLDRIEQTVANGGDPAPWYRWLAKDRRSREDDQRVSDIRNRLLFRDHRGTPLTLVDIAAQESQLSFVLIASGETAFDDAVAKAGFVLLADDPALSELLQLCHTTRFSWISSWRTLKRADQAFVMPEVLDIGALDQAEQTLVAATQEHLRRAVGLRLSLPGASRVFAWAPQTQSVANRLGLAVGDFGGTDLGSEETLAINGPADTGVFQRPNTGGIGLPAFLHWRTLLVNRHHPLFRTATLAAGEDLEVAAYGLAQALLHAESVEPEASYRRMLAGATETWGWRQ
jgi:hypothetical protein